MLTTEFDGDDGLIETFSDGTSGAFVVEELLELRPVRGPVKTEKTEMSLRTSLRMGSFLERLQLGFHMPRLIVRECVLSRMHGALSAYHHPSVSTTRTRIVSTS